MSSEHLTRSANLRIWDEVKQPPPTALKPIIGGRLKGKTDINPMWRIQKLTELYGSIGFGWRYEIVRLWIEQGEYIEESACHAIIANAEIKLYVKQDKEWSEAIPGVGGNLLVQKEASGAHTNDEGYKMAVTDAISVATKELGFGADIYFGRWDGSKYNIPIDDSMVADWIHACEKSKKEDTPDDFKAWWPGKKDAIKKALGDAGAALVWNRFNELLGPDNATD